MADKDTERIKYETELLKLMVLFLLAIGGSAIGLLLGERTTFRLILALSGIVVSVCFAIGAWQQHRAIRKIISVLKESSS